uniref:Secreted protein n=1 Tax=Toxocara canis TaxID=6265 RepID=A0A183U6T5_TOXCA
LGFELCRCQLEPRRTVGLFSSNNSKYLKVFWEHVGAADIADHSTTKRVVRITWLPIARPLQRRVQRAESTGFNAMKSGSMSSGTGSVGSYRSESFNHRDGLQFSADLAWSRSAASRVFLNFPTTLITASTSARHLYAFRPPASASCSV